MRNLQKIVSVRRV